MNSFLQRVIELRDENPEEAERLMAIYRRTTEAIRAGELDSFNVDGLLAAESVDEINAAIRETAEATEEGSRRMPLPTYELLEDGTGELDPIRSVPRACLAGFMFDAGIDLRAQRLTGFLPMDGMSMDQIQTTCRVTLPARMPEEGYIAYGQQVIWDRIVDYCEKHNLIPIACEPLGASGRFTITLIDRPLAEDLCPTRGKLHYLAGLFSAAAEMNGEADYREVRVVGVTREQMNTLYQLLGMSGYYGDGDGLYVAETDVRYGLDSDQPENGFIETGEAQIIQGRWCSPTHGSGFYAKGVIVPIWRRAAQEAYDKATWDVIMTSAMDDNAHAEARIMRSVVQALINGAHVLVEGDMVKLGEAMSQPAFFAGTYLRSGGTRNMHILEGEEKLVTTDGVVSAIYPQPVQRAPYTMNGSSQQTMFLTASASGGLSKQIRFQMERLTNAYRSPAQLAKVFSQHAALLREDAEFGVDDLMATNTAELALASGMVRPTNAALEKLARGENPEPGELAVMPGLGPLIERTIAARARDILLGFGMTFDGHLVLIGPDDPQEIAWRNGIVTSSLTAVSPTEFDVEISQSPFACRVAFMPKSLATAVNADTDGDIGFGRSGLFYQPDGRVLKGVLIGRYPQVDGMPCWVVDPSYGTVYDLDMELGELMMDTFGIGTAQETFREEVVIAEETHSLRLLEASKNHNYPSLTGPVTMDLAMDSIWRKLHLNQTGRLTRQMERLCVAVNVIEQMAAKEGWTPRLIDARNELHERLREITVCLEAEITAFKKDVPKMQAPRVWLGSNCPIGYSSELEASRDLLPSPSYHAQIAKIRTLTGFNRQPGEEPLLNLRGIEGRGKEPFLLKYHTHNDNGAARPLVDAHRRIDFSGTLQRQQLQKFIAANEASVDRVQLEVEVQRVLASIDMWSREFRRIITERDAAWHESDHLEHREREALMHQLRAETQRKASTLRGVMRAVSNSVSAVALAKGIETHFVHVDKARSNAKQRKPAMGGVLALLESRAGEVFPLSLQTVRLSKPANALTVFTRGADLPGEILEETPGVIVVLDKAAAPAVAKLTFAGVTYTLYSDSAAVIPDHVSPKLRRTHARRGVLVF